MGKINIAELLKDCPKGMELYSPIFGNVYLCRVRPSLAVIVRVSDRQEEFLYDGRFGINGECMLFPSKENRDWSTFQRPFKDGDVLSNGICICIYNGNENENYYGLYVGVGHIDYPKYFIVSTQNSYFTKKNAHLATKEEKQKLFKAIKDNGYRWNAETKTLEKLIVPKFKVGDRIRHKVTNKDDVYEISEVYDDSYGLVDFTWMIYMKYQDDYELVPNKFDIHTLKAFEEVLVRMLDDIKNIIKKEEMK